MMEMELPGRWRRGRLKEKIFGCGEGGYRGGWCEGDRRYRQDGLEKNNTLWLPLIEGKGRKEKKKE